MLTLLPRTIGKFGRTGLKVNKLRYHCEGYTEQYLSDGTATVAYNPEDVTSVCMVGTPESAVFFEQALQLTRRSLGLRYDVMKYDMDFRNFCEIVFSYQYVKQRTEITDGIREWVL